MSCDDDRQMFWVAACDGDGAFAVIARSMADVEVVTRERATMRGVPYQARLITAAPRIPMGGTDVAPNRGTSPAEPGPDGFRTPSHLPPLPRGATRIRAATLAGPMRPLTPKR